jgi:RES domain-containing protein
MTHHPEHDPADTPEVRELVGVIASCYPSASGFSGVVVRSVNTKYATASDFFSGVGASKSGGRWNRKGLEVTYTSLDIETAIKEAYQNLLHYGFPISNIRPRTTAGARVNSPTKNPGRNRSVAPASLPASNSKAVCLANWSQQ